jgi:hypothetical protein
MSPDATSSGKANLTLEPTTNGPARVEKPSILLQSHAVRNEWQSVDNVATSLDVHGDAEAYDLASIQLPQASDSLPQASLSEKQPLANTAEQLNLVESEVGPTRNEFSWLFQEPGLFGLPGDNSFSLPGDEYFNMLLDASVDLGPSPLESIQIVSEWYSMTAPKC